MAMLIAYVDKNPLQRVHITDYDETQHKGRLTCAYEHPVIAKRGQKVTWHYSHTGKHDDDCCRKMGEWHRWWQDRVYADFLEIQIVKTVDDRQIRHIADMINAEDVVVEFQKSVVPEQTLRDRESFYKHMIWVFCCTDHNIQVTHSLGRFVRIALLSGSKYFLDAKATTFLDFGRRGVVEMLQVDRKKKSKPVIYGKVWSQRDFDSEYMSGCLKPDADHRVHHQPYEIVGDCEKLQEFVKYTRAKKHKN